MSAVLLTFNGYRHAADKVLGKASIPIAVSYKDINDDFNLVGLDNIGDTTKYYKGTTVFIKFEGKFVPLLGRSKVLTDTTNPERIIKGMLITSVALKATRIDEPVKGAGPVTLNTPIEGARISKPDEPLKRFDALRDRYSSAPPVEQRSNKNYGGHNRPESATGSSLRSRSPYRGTLKRNGV